MKSFVKNRFGTILIIVGVVLLYELATDINQWLEPVLFPGLTKIIPALILSLPKLLSGLVSSFGLLVPAYFLGGLLGISLGLLVGLNSVLRKNLTPIFHGLSPIPPTLFIPYAITILPTFWHSSAFIIFIGSFWPFLNGTISGVVLIEQKYLDNARTLELKGPKLLFNVILPAASPLILAGAGTALNFSFILLTIAEMFGTNSGLGFFIQYYADFSDYSRVLAGLFFMSCFIITIMLAFDMLKKKILFWTMKD
jgi:NitT/TauT family transport system permease protein